MSDTPTGTRPALAAAIRTFVARQFPHAGRAAPGDDDPLLQSGVVDSLGILEIVGFLGDEFGIEVTDEELTPENFATVNALAAFAGRKLEAAAR